MKTQIPELFEIEHPIIQGGVHCVGLTKLAAAVSCAGGVGLRTMTLDYLRSRVQFGIPTGANLALQHRMANLLIDIEQARSTVINAASAIGRDRKERERALAAAGCTIGATGAKAAKEAIQFHAASA